MITCMILDSLKRSCIGKLLSMTMHYVLPGCMMSLACTLAEQMVVVNEMSKDRKTLIQKYGHATRDMTVYTFSVN